MYLNPVLLKPKLMDLLYNIRRPKSWKQRATIHSDPKLIPKEQEAHECGLWQAVSTRETEILQALLGIWEFLFYSFVILTMHCVSPEASQKLNQNVLHRISNRKSGPQFGFHFQAEDTLWRQEIQPRKSTHMAGKWFIYFLMWLTKLLTGTMSNH